MAGPHAHVGPPELLRQPVAQLRREQHGVVDLGRGNGADQRTKSRQVFLTCLSSADAPLPTSKATLTGANAGCSFRT